MYVVVIRYTDGQVLETLPLAKEHAESHCATVLTYPTVASAEVVLKTPQ
jgi:hypothetical protein